MTNYEELPTDVENELADFYANPNSNGRDSGPDVDDDYDVESTDDEIIVSPREPDVKMRVHWRKMEQYERAVENIEYWQAEIERAKTNLKMCKDKASHLKIELDGE